VFAYVQKPLQISIFFPECCRLCSLLFAWVGVRLVSTGIRRFRQPSCVFVARNDEFMKARGRGALRSSRGRLRRAGGSQSPSREDPHLVFGITQPEQIRAASML
jgi:hypothetical protein